MMKTTQSHLLIALLLLLGTVFLASATTLQSLAQTIQPQQTNEHFTDVVIVSVGDETVNFKDSDYDPAKLDTTPLLVYGDMMTLTWNHPISAKAGQFTKISFVWCEKDDAACDTSTQTLVKTVQTLDNTATFEIPTKFFDSYVKFQLEHSEDEVLIRYTSLYKYHSDITTKGKKSIATIVIVFCVIMLLIGLAVLAFIIVKKCKKMRRGRHFSSSYTYRSN